MKATDFKREHFHNGMHFSQEEFNAYIRASEKFAKAAGGKYLAFVGGGLLLSFVFSQGIGGFAGNMLALVCIFAGLIVGGISNGKAAREVNACAARLGITKADIKAARQHVKNGTVAWSSGNHNETAPSSETSAAAAGNPCASCGQTLLPNDRFCKNCGAGITASSPAANEAAATPALTLNPKRAVWAAGIMIVSWFMLLLLQCIFGMRPQFSGDSIFMIVAALYGTAVYLIMRPEKSWKLFGGGAGLVAVLLSAHSSMLVRSLLMYGRQPRLIEMFRAIDLGNIVYVRTLGGAFLTGVLTLAAAWVLYTFVKKGDEKHRARRAALGAAGVFCLVDVIRNLISAGMMLPRMGFLQIFSMFSSPVFDAACLFFAFIAVYCLCSMPSKRVKLRGIGLVWAWIAAVGMLISLISVISTATGGDNGVITYTAQAVLAVMGMIGYIMLLCKRRMGLYFILLGVGVMLGAQFATSLNGMIAGAGQFALLTISTLIAGVNPLFAWLAVRAADKRSAIAPQPAMAAAVMPSVPAGIPDTQVPIVNSVPVADSKPKAAISGKIRHIVCLCYDAPYINDLKPQMQRFILEVEQQRGSIIMPDSRITFDSFYDNASLEKPDMILQKLTQIYTGVYGLGEAKELAQKTIAREVQYQDGHTLVKYFVLYS